MEERTLVDSITRNLPFKYNGSKGNTKEGWFTVIFRHEPSEQKFYLKVYTALKKVIVGYILGNAFHEIERPPYSENIVVESFSDINDILEKNREEMDEIINAAAQYNFIPDIFNSKITLTHIEDDNVVYYLSYNYLGCLFSDSPINNTSLVTRATYVTKEDVIAKLKSKNNEVYDLIDRVAN